MIASPSTLICQPRTDYTSVGQVIFYVDEWHPSNLFNVCVGVINVLIGTLCRTTQPLIKSGSEHSIPFTSSRPERDPISPTPNFCPLRAGNDIAYEINDITFDAQRELSERRSEKSSIGLLERSFHTIGICNPRTRRHTWVESLFIEF